MSPHMLNRLILSVLTFIVPTGCSSTARILTLIHILIEIVLNVRSSKAVILFPGSFWQKWHVQKSKPNKAALQNVFDYPSYIQLFYVCTTNRLTSVKKKVPQAAPASRSIYMDFCSCFFFFYWKCFLMTLEINHLLLEPTQGCHLWFEQTFF